MSYGNVYPKFPLGGSSEYGGPRYSSSLPSYGQTFTYNDVLRGRQPPKEYEDEDEYEYEEDEEDEEEDEEDEKMDDRAMNFFAQIGPLLRLGRIEHRGSNGNLFNCGFLYRAKIPVGWAYFDVAPSKSQPRRLEVLFYVVTEQEEHRGVSSSSVPRYTHVLGSPLEGLSLLFFRLVDFAEKRAEKRKETESNRAPPPAPPPPIDLSDNPETETDMVKNRRMAVLDNYVSLMDKLTEAEIAAHAGVTVENVRAYKLRHNLGSTAQPSKEPEQDTESRDEAIMAPFAWFTSCPVCERGISANTPALGAMSSKQRETCAVHEDPERPGFVCPGSLHRAYNNHWVARSLDFGISGFPRLTYEQREYWERASRDSPHLEATQAGFDGARIADAPILRQLGLPPPRKELPRWAEPKNRLRVPESEADEWKRAVARADIEQELKNILLAFCSEPTNPIDERQPPSYKTSGPPAEGLGPLAERPPTIDPEERKMTHPYSQAPALTIFQALNADMAQAAKEGLTAGATAGAVSVLVDNVVRLFPDTPMLAMIAASRLGRAALNISVPYGVALVCDIYPALIPGNAAVVRDLCLSAARGQFTVIAMPLLTMLAAPISQFVTTIVAHAPAAVAAAAAAPPAAPPTAPPAAPPVDPATAAAVAAAATAASAAALSQG